MSDSEEVVFEVRDGVALATLNRPAALNALTLGMVRALHSRLLGWARDDAVRAVVARGAGGKAFCAGGDIRALYDGRGTAFTADFFRDEYRLNRTIFHYPKPYLVLMDGITMGGGVGISVHARHRIAAEATVFAMPETGIGMFPDVGGSYFLPRMPGETGLYVALTGTRLRAADCVYAGVADAVVPRGRLPRVVETLRRGESVEDAVAEAREAAGEGGGLEASRAAIDRFFAHDSVEEIETALAAEGGDWAAKTLSKMRSKSPVSQKIAFRQIREGARLDFDDCMRMEFRLSQRVMAGHDFFEGVRAAVVDKDRAPVWRPDRLDAVSKADLDEYFAPLGTEELTFLA